MVRGGLWKCGLLEGGRMRVGGAVLLRLTPRCLRGLLVLGGGGGDGDSTINAGGMSV